MNCKICNNNSTKYFKKNILNKYDITYYKCQNCGFIQTEDPYWLDESYTDAIALLDVGLVSRNNLYSKISREIIIEHFNYQSKFIDYGGGYGLFVRLMRDMGFDFYRQDKYCKNIFANFFDLENCDIDQKFELLTAFEVFEHLNNPIEEINNMFKYSDTILFSTELYKTEDIKKLSRWWYLASETGQHISFYSLTTLEFIAKKFDCVFFSNNNLHLLSKKKDCDNVFQIYNKTQPNIVSLLSSDYEKLKIIYNDYEEH